MQYSTNAKSLGITALVTLALQGCGGGDSGSGMQPVETLSSPSVEITFPLKNSALGGTDTVMVAGLLTDPADSELGPDDIRDFNVNGAQPQLDLATGRWSIELPTTGEDFTVTASVTGSSGAVDEAEVSATNKAAEADYFYLAPSTDGSTLYVYGSDALRALDRDTGNEELLSSNLGMTDDARFAVMNGIRVDEDNNRLYVLRRGDSGQAVSIALDNGSSEPVGSLPGAPQGRFQFFFEYLDFALAPASNQLVYTHRADRAFDSIDNCSLGVLNLATGALTEVVQTASIEDPVLDPKVGFCPKEVVFDSSRNRAIVTADNRLNPFGLVSNFTGIYAIDLTTGSRSLVSGIAGQTGPEFVEPQRLFATSDTDTILAVGESSIFTVAIDDGDRTLLLDNVTLPNDITDMAFDEANNQMLIANGGQTVTALDLANGEPRNILSFSRAVGTGPHFSAASLPVVDSPRKRILVLENIRSELVEIDLTTLSRTVVATNLADNDSQRLFVDAAVVDADGSTLYFFDNGTRQLMAVSPETGEVRVVSADREGSDLQLYAISGISLSADNDMAYLTGAYTNSGNFGVVSVDLTTGARRVISPKSEAPDADDTGLRQQLYDPDNNRLLTISVGGALLGVNLETGERTVLVAADSQSVRDATALEWDSVEGRLLVQGTEFSTDGSPADNVLISVDLETGERAVIKKSLRIVAVDSRRGVIYSNEIITNLENTGLLRAIDRYTGEESVIARAILDFGG